MRKQRILSVFTLLLFVSLLLNIGTLATTYGASSYVFESGFENDFFASGEWDGWWPQYPLGELSRGTVTDGYPVFNGSYSARTAGMGWGKQKMLYKNLGVQLNEIYVRTYVYFPSLYTYPHQDTGEDCYWTYFMMIVPEVPIPPAYNNPDIVAMVSGHLRIYYDAQLDRYVFTGGKYDGTQGNRYYIPAGTPLGAIEAGRWYYVEWYHKMASDYGVRDGIWRLYVDDLVPGEPHVYYEDTEVPNYEPNGPYFGAVFLGNFETPGSQNPDTPAPTMYFDSVVVSDQYIGPEPEEYMSTPLKWALIVLGGYNYYTSDPDECDKNSIQRVEKWVQGRGVPYDLFADDDIEAPTDTPSSGKHPLQYSNGNPRYQVLVIMCDKYTDSSALNVNHIYSAVQNGSNAVVFGTAANLVSDLFGGVSVTTGSGSFTCSVQKTFNDGVKEHTQGSLINLTAGNYIPYLSGGTGTVWFNMNGSPGMLNTTQGNGKVWYVGFIPNEFAMDYGPYEDAWGANNWNFFGHVINFAFNSAEKFPVRIMPYKRWKGALIIHVDEDHVHSPYGGWVWSNEAAMTAAEAGWSICFELMVIGGFSWAPLTDGSPSATGLPSASKMKYTTQLVVPSDGGDQLIRTAIIYDSDDDGTYNKIKIDYNNDNDFSDELAYSLWEPWDYAINWGELYWLNCGEDLSCTNPSKIMIAYWKPFRDVGQIRLDTMKTLGSQYDWGWEFHGWTHHGYIGNLGVYYRWNGSSFIADQQWMEQKLLEARDELSYCVGPTGNGFEANLMGGSDPGNRDEPQEARNVKESYWKWKRKTQSNVGWFLPSENEIPWLNSFDEGNDNEYDVYIEMLQTLYPAVCIYRHAMTYDLSKNFTPYSNMPKPASSKSSLVFWRNAMEMLKNTQKAYYYQNKIVLEFVASPNLTEFVWKFPSEYAGKYFRSFFDNRSVGQLVKTDGEDVYVEFSQGAGGHRIEVSYARAHECSLTFASSAASDVSVTIDGTTHTIPYASNYACETILSITAPSSVAGEGSTYTFDHWADDQGFSAESNSISYTVPSTSSATLTAYYVSTEDSIPPTITHTPITTGNEGQTITITATITDNVAVTGATLHYRKREETVYTGVTMIKFGDTYRATIPSSVVTTVGVQYYINATDAVNVATEPATNPTTLPHTITIGAENLPPTAVTLNDPSNITEDSMKLTWTPNSDADFVAYEIYQSTSPGTIGTKIYAITDRSTTSYTVTGLSPKTTYYFTIRVLDAGGLTTDSNQVSGKTVSSPTNEWTGWITVLVVAAVVVTAALITIFIIRRKRG